MVDDLHGSVFGAAGDGAAGEHGFDDFGNFEIWLGCAGYLGVGVVKMFELHEGTVFSDFDGAGLAEFADVVAAEVDDHG